jgi:hypothetical protein
MASELCRFIGLLELFRVHKGVTEQNSEVGGFQGGPEANGRRRMLAPRASLAVHPWLLFGALSGLAFC